MRKWWALIGVGIASMIIAIDCTIVFTALSTLQRYFSANVAQLQWFMTGFGITFAALLTAMGRLADQWGRRRVLYLGMLGFVLSSIGAGLSESSNTLIAFRLLQGFFGAANFPAGVAIISHVFPKGQHGRVLGIYGALLGIGLAIGPFLGGVIISLASWRWIFFINIPIILISFLICLFAVEESKARKSSPVDWKAVILLILGLAALIFGITEGPLLGWDSPWVWGSLVAFVVIVALFVYGEKRSPNPLLPLHLIATPGFIVGSLVFFATVSCAWAVSFLSPLYLQNVLNFTPFMTGLIYATMTATTILGSFTAGHLLDKKGAPFILWGIFLVLTFSYFFQIYLGLSGPLWALLAAFVLFGYAWGAGNGIGMPLALAHLKKGDEAGTVTGALTTVLNVLGVVILAVITSVFQHGEKAELAHQMQNRGIVFSASEAEQVRSLLSHPEEVKAHLGQSGEIGAKIIELFKSAFVAGYRLSMILLLALSILAFYGVRKALKARDRKSSK